MRPAPVLTSKAAGVRSWRLGVALLAVLSVASCLAPHAAQARPTFSRSRSNRPSHVCGKPRSGRVMCLSVQVPSVRASSQDAIGPAFEGSGELGGLSPADLRAAYGLQQIQPGELSGGTIGIVDAFNDPNAYSDMTVYRETYGLPPCKEATECFVKVNQKGERSNFPANEAHWSEEISLDLDMASAICPSCRIVLAEATTNTFENLVTAEKAAEFEGAVVISDSWGSEEFAGETSWDKYFNHPPVPTVVAAGDIGNQATYPATSRYTVAVGGTTLEKDSSVPRGWSEEVWGGSGGGCSAYESKPSWQSDPGCANRTDNDVSAVAATSTPVSVYDSFEREGWTLFGGTSVATPIVASLEALGGEEMRAAAAKEFYAHPGALFDVTVGSNGSCGGSYLCTAKPGYDGPTGNGTVDSLASSSLASVSTPSVVRDPSNGEQSAFFVTESGEIAYWEKSATGAWGNAKLGGSVRSGTSPAATLEPGTGNQAVYYVNPAGEMAYWAYAEKTGWTNGVLGGSVRSGTSPVAVYDPAYEVQAVYYVNTSGEVAYLANPKKTGWISGVLGGSVRAGTSPVLSIDPSAGIELVYYVTTGGEVDLWFFKTGSWEGTVAGGSVRSGTNPAVAPTFNSSSGEVIVYFVNPSGEIAFRYFEGGVWHNGLLGGEAGAGTSPAVVSNTETGSQYLDYVDSSGEIAYKVFEGSWISGVLGGNVLAGTSPALVRDASSGDQWLYYLNEKNDVWSWTSLSAVLANGKL